MRRSKFAWLAYFIVAASSQSRAALSTDQIRTFRSWIVTIAEDQIARGPNPRWNQRDCAGLVRFAVHEALENHDMAWRKANGFLGKPLPAEMKLTHEERTRLKSWRAQGATSQFARALPLIQENAQFIGKTTERAEPGDLMFFDQGDDQHVMIWTGPSIVYHNGAKPRPADNGLRKVTYNDLMNWPDSRWRPNPENPNFVGFFRLQFLSKAGLQ